MVRDWGPTKWILVFYGILSAVAFAIGALRGDFDIYRVNQQTDVAQLFMSPILGIGAGLFLVAMSRLASKHTRWAQELNQEFYGLLGPLKAQDTFILAMASSVGEEFLFRGALLPVIGVWPQAILFAGLHVGPRKTFLPWTACALLVGVLFGYLARYSGDLGAPIAAHFLVNFLNLSFICRLRVASPYDHLGLGVEGPASPL
jgi:membrane protease YdiL (CAAX protease family)